jgi:hypothetical protein
MDDDSSGSLDMAEFTKAMRECELVDLRKKAVEHIFRYLDADDSGNVLCLEDPTSILLHSCAMDCYAMYWVERRCLVQHA